MRWKVLAEQTIAIVLAAGQGKRMGYSLNKQYLHLLDKPVLAHTLQAFEQEPLIDGVIVVAKSSEIEYCQEKIVKAFDLRKVIKVTSGGKERQDSVYAGIQHLPDECNLVVVHDGARPLIAPDLLSQVIEKGRQAKAVITAVPVKDTIKKVRENGIVECTLSRSELWAVQTPQVFQKEIILAAYREAMAEGFYGTDDASLVERIGVEVQVVHGSYENIKITTPEDLEVAEIILKRRKLI
ncbi:MAG: 2-C-methyl-D-erythritol 4-phosphate cytidylyltransferase [Clostridia bacterium]|nr:2-C-methyl-D-erythritol 4-phosphate cytidylyltransferase [Clostridia bacterium]